MRRLCPSLPVVGYVRPWAASKDLYPFSNACWAVFPKVLSDLCSRMPASKSIVRSLA